MQRQFLPGFISGHHMGRNDLRAVLVLFLFVASDFTGPCFHLSSLLDQSARFVNYLLCIIFHVITSASLERGFYSIMLGLMMWLGGVCPFFVPQGTYLWLKTAVLRLAAGMKLGWLKTFACVGVSVEWLGQVVNEKSALEAIWRLHSQSFSCLCWHVSEKCQS